MKLIMAEFHLAALISASSYCSCWLTVALTATLEEIRDIFSVIINTCAFPAVTSPSVCCEESLWNSTNYYSLDDPAKSEALWLGEPECYMGGPRPTAVGLYMLHTIHPSIIGAFKGNSWSRVIACTRHAGKCLYQRLKILQARKWVT